MPRIHYFQRYSSVENTVTNNTLQLLARIYAYSPTKASIFISELTGEPIEIGIEINQQERGEESVPEGSVIQRSFKILVESKVDAEHDAEQLLKHTDSFSAEDQKILLLLTKRHIGSDEEDVKKRVRENKPDVIFKNITYEDICKVASSLFQEYEYEMCELTGDYEDYCNDIGLFDQSPYLMRIVPCGQSLEINKKYGIYFHPSDRGYTPHQYVGIYKDKEVQVVWEIDSVFDVQYSPDEGLQKARVQGRNTSDYDEKIKAIIEDAREQCGYEIASGHRFFCGQPVTTSYRKISPYGIQGARFVNLREVIGEFDGLSDIAQKLSEKEWE